MSELKTTRNYRTQKINADALSAELKKRDLTYAEVGRTIGHGSTYMKNALSNGRISDASIMLLQHLYNIDPDIYLLKEPEVTEEEPKPSIEVQSIPQTIELTWDSRKLYNLINNAVFNAVRRAFGEEETSNERE